MSNTCQVYFLKGVEWDATYKNVVSFATPEIQLDYFTKKAINSISIPIARIRNNQFNVDKTIDEVNDYEYLFYYNQSRHYYCFITAVEYVNENTTKIKFETDIFQTYHFDYYIKDGFVKRGHINRYVKIGDRYYPNTSFMGEAEPFSASEYVKQTEIDTEIPLIKNSFPENDLVENARVMWLTCCFAPRAENNIIPGYAVSAVINNIATNLVIYTIPFLIGDKITCGDVDFHVEIYKEGNPTPWQTINYTFGAFINYNFLAKTIFKLDDLIVLDVSEMPPFSHISDDIEFNFDNVYKWLSVKYVIKNSENLIFRSHVDTGDLTYPDMLQLVNVKSAEEIASVFPDYSVAAINDGYDPKIYALPTSYSQINLITGDEFKLNYGKGENIIKIKHIVGNHNGYSIFKRTQTAQIFPDITESETLILKTLSNISLPISSEKWINYYFNNRASLNASMNALRDNESFATLKAGSGIASGVLTSLTTFNPFTAFDSVVGGLEKINQSRNAIDIEMARRQDIQNAPNIIKNSDGDLLVTALGYGGKTTASIFAAPIKEVELHNNYYFRYGYTLNIFFPQNPSFLKSRKRFNYIETTNITIGGLMRNDIKNKIASAFNNGLTLWHVRELKTYYPDIIYYGNSGANPNNEVDFE